MQAEALSKEETVKCPRILYISSDLTRLCGSYFRSQKHAVCCEKKVVSAGVVATCGMTNAWTEILVRMPVWKYSDEEDDFGAKWKLTTMEDEDDEIICEDMTDLYCTGRGSGPKCEEERLLQGPETSINFSFQRENAHSDTRGGKLVAACGSCRVNGLGDTRQAARTSSGGLQLRRPCHRFASIGRQTVVIRLAQSMFVR